MRRRGSHLRAPNLLLRLPIGRLWGSISRSGIVILENRSSTWTDGNFHTFLCNLGKVSFGRVILTLWLVFMNDNIVGATIGY